MCDGPIDTPSLSFEQRLVDDRDFCRASWDELMYGEEEVTLPSLVVEATTYRRMA
jgi:hypothetical protein